MDYQMGFFIITVAVIKLVAGGNAVRMMPVQVNKVHCARSEALVMMREHKKQCGLQDERQHYSYDWQPEREDWNDVS